MYLRIVLAVNDDVGKGEQLQFFCNFLFSGGKTFAVCLPYIGEQTYGTTNNRRQLFHLSHPGNTGLKQGQLVLGLQLPYRQRRPYLRIVTLGAAYDAKILV